ncbi:MAG: molybdopterin-guanine dinucleotide biosynthesis protein B [Promethearchaeota archaeon]
MGNSGSGKTYFIVNAIRILKSMFNFNIAVIKNIHEHQIDKKGKDSFQYTKAGANFAITKNIYNETTIFLKRKIEFETLIEWINKSPYSIEILFTEGFRDLSYPAILCLKNFNEINNQLTPNIRMISGLFLKNKTHEAIHLGIPIIDINKNFNKFLEIFNIRELD